MDIKHLKLCLAYERSLIGTRETNTFGINLALVIARESFGPEFMASEFSLVTAREA